MTLGLDYSARPANGTLVARAGYQFVCRYLSYDEGKNITPTEYASMLGAGVAVVLVWETFARRMAAGHQGGVDDAHQARYMAEWVGHPPERPIYFACDWDAAPGEQAAINAYLDGVASVIGRGRVGIYGGYWPLSRALDAGKATYAWQTLAWSGGNLDPRSHITQRIGTVRVGGLECDVDEAHAPDYGQHPCPALTEEEPMGYVPIPVAPGVERLTIPYETGNESAVVAASWVTLSAAWGDLTDIRVWCGHDDGTPAGVDERFDLPSNNRRFVRLPDNASGAANIEFTRHATEGYDDMCVGLGLVNQPK